MQVIGLTIKWMVNPFIFGDDYSTRLYGNMTTSTLMDARGVDLELKNLTEPIEMSQPTQFRQSTSIIEMIECAYWDEKTFTFENDGCGIMEMEDV